MGLQVGFRRDSVESRYLTSVRSAYEITGTEQEETSMTTRTTSLITAAAALAGLPAMAQAAPTGAAPIPQASSYAELLEPIPNAVERLKAADAEVTSQQGEIVQAQYYPPAPGPGPGYHHHHHHNRRWYMRNGYSWYRGQWVLRPVHHHHHHHSSY